MCGSVVANLLLGQPTPLPPPKQNSQKPIPNHPQTPTSQDYVGHPTTTTLVCLVLYAYKNRVVRQTERQSCSVLYPLWRRRTSAVACIHSGPNTYIARSLYETFTLAVQLVRMMVLKQQSPSLDCDSNEMHITRKLCGAYDQNMEREQTWEKVSLEHCHGRRSHFIQGDVYFISKYRGTYT